MIGFAAYGPTEQPDTFKLHKLYLHPDWRGRGFGSRLLQHCEGESRKRGAQRLILAVNKRNAKAIAAYQRNDFVIAESVVTWPRIWPDVNPLAAQFRQFRFQPGNDRSLPRPAG